MTIIRCSAVALAALLTSCAAPSAKPPLKTVAHVDLPRYMGDWHVIANIPYSLEKDKVGTFDRYALNADGSIQNLFFFHRKSFDAPLEEWKGKASVYNKTSNAEWRVQFIWPLRMPYLVIDLDKNYQWTVIGYPSRKLAWVLSRKTSLDSQTYAGILRRLKAQGYDPNLLVKVPQRP